MSTTKPEEADRIGVPAWRVCRWYDASEMTAEDAGYDPGEKLPPITSIRDEKNRSVASAHDLFEFDPEQAAIMAQAPRLLAIVEVMASPDWTAMPDALKERWLAEARSAVVDARTVLPDICPEPDAPAP